MTKWQNPLRRSPIKQRIQSAAIALPLLILLIAFANPVIFSCFLTLVLLLALLEFNRMGLAADSCMEQWFAALFGAMVCPLLLYQKTEYLFALLTLAMLVLALLFLFRLPPLEELPKRLGWLCLGVIYLPLLLGHLIPLRLLPDGRKWIFMTLLVIMVCDTFAYFIGSKLGKHKLYPAVSPNKSIEGAIGGLFGSVLAVMLARMFFMPQIGVIDGLFIGLLLGTVGQLGDLFESLLKRACGVKDSGALIPGHGGVLDRLDSLLFAFPVIYYVARFGYLG